jgi:hypothetical protein
MAEFKNQSPMILLMINGKQKLLLPVMVVAFNAAGNQSGVLISSYDKRGLGCSCSNIFQRNAALKYA